MNEGNCKKRIQKYMPERRDGRKLIPIFPPSLQQKSLRKKNYLLPKTSLPETG